MTSLLKSLTVAVAVLGTAAPAVAQTWGCYNPQPGHPTTSEKTSFVNQISALAVQAEQNYGVPAAGLTAMACNESGYGWTRIALNANNLFGYKWVSQTGAGGRWYWELACQPASDPNKKYILFSDRADCVDFIAYKLATVSWYQPVTAQYQADIAAGMNNVTAVNRWVTGIQQAGYNPDPNYVNVIKSYLNNYMTPSTAYSSQYNLYHLSPVQNVWVSIDSPANGTTVMGNVAIQASTGGGTVTSVKFYSRAAGASSWYLLATDTTVPYSTSWATDPWVANGQYELKVEALNGTTVKAAGTRTVTVANHAVEITAPAFGATVNGTVPITATVTGSVNSVKFYTRAKGASSWYLLGTDSASPYSMSWATSPWVADGLYEILAEGYAGTTLKNIDATEVRVDN